jgi:hypothetical protein
VVANLDRIGDDSTFFHCLAELGQSYLYCHLRNPYFTDCQPFSLNSIII